MSASETGALRAGENGVVSPEQIKRCLNSDLMIACELLEKAMKRVEELEAKCARLERENANLSLKSRGR